MSAADRVEAFLNEGRAFGADVDSEGVIIELWHDLKLTVDDLRELVEKARLADAVKAERSIQRGFRRSANDRLQPGQIDQRVVAPMSTMQAQDAGRAPKFERPTAISMTMQAPLGDWVEVDEWSAR